MKKTALLLIAGMIILAGGLVQAWAQDAAMVVDIKSGQAFFETEAKKGQKIGIMDFLVKGDKVRLDPATVMVLNYFASGTREEISGPGMLTVGLMASEKIGSVDIKSNKMDFAPPMVAFKSKDTQHAGAIAIRSAPSFERGEVTVITPDRSAIRGPAVRFSWRPFSGAKDYILVVTGPKGVLLSQKTDQTEFTWNKISAVNGAELKWVVSASSDYGVIAVGEGRFYALSEAEVNQLNVVERYIKTNYPAGSTEGRIALAMLYMKYELNDDASAVLNDLAQAHPGNDNVKNALRALKNNYRPKTG